MFYIGGVILFIFAMLVSIALHENGHKVVAQLLKMKVPRFFVGFGPTIFSRKHKGTEYGLKAIPAGGFVEILPSDEDDPTVNRKLIGANELKNSPTDEEREKDREFRRSMLSHVAPWKRILVFAAGPVVNIVLGFGLLVASFWIAPVLHPQPYVDYVNDCSTSSSCVAQKAGFQKGDKITAVDGESTPTAQDISQALTPNKESSVTVLRDSKEVDLTVTPDSKGIIGINFTATEESRTLPEAVGQTFHVFGNTLQVITDLPERFMNTASIIWGNDRSDETIGSVVSAGNSFGVTASDQALDTDKKAVTLLAYVGAFNLSIGFINLLPLMPLDGGRIAWALADSIRNKYRSIRGIRASAFSSSIVQRLSGATIAVVMLGFAVIVLADIISPAGS